jgi:hypothetical protein
VFKTRYAVFGWLAWKVGKRLMRRRLRTLR